MSRNQPSDKPKLLTRIIVAEDDPAMRVTIERQIELTKNLTCVGSASSFAEAKKLVDRTIFDIAILDINLGDGSGLDLIATIKQEKQVSPRYVLMATVLADQQSVLKAVEAGADGYIWKDASDTDLIKAIEDLQKGYTPMSPAIASHLLLKVRELTSSPAAEPPQTQVDLLTRREMEILQALSRGYTYNEVATQFGIKVNTVSFHVKHIYTKLGVNSRSAAIYRAVNKGMLQLDDC